MGMLEEELVSVVKMITSDKFEKQNLELKKLQMELPQNYMKHYQAFLIKLLVVL
jgi:hypothetical protein